MATKQCDICGTNFIAFQGKEKRCSTKCVKEYRRQYALERKAAMRGATRKCYGCGDLVPTFPGMRKLCLKCKEDAKRKPEKKRHDCATEGCDNKIILSKKYCKDCVKIHAEEIAERKQQKIAMLEAEAIRKKEYLEQKKKDELSKDKLAQLRKEIREERVAIQKNKRRGYSEIDDKFLTRGKIKYAGHRSKK